MCIAKYISLWAKTDKEYIKHLESFLLDGEDYKRCYVCGRVQDVEHMVEVLDGDEYVCEGHCEKEFNFGKEILESDERDYRQAKGDY